MVISLKNLTTRVCRSCNKEFKTNVAMRKCLQCGTKRTSTSSQATKPLRKPVKPTLKKKKPKKPISLTKEGKKTWVVFALMLKYEQKNFQDNFTCYTCEVLKHISEAQAGHCAHRGRECFKSVDFDDEKHIKLQCATCNGPKAHIYGNIFQMKLTEELGTEEFKKLLWRRHHEQPLTRQQLIEMRAVFQDRLDKAKKRWFGI